MTTELSPNDASRLAFTVYTVNNGSEKDLKAFLNDKLFNRSTSNKNLLKAEVGGRVFRAAKDAFGVCALGAGTHQGDLFLIFRGTTKANNNADSVTDARIGIAFSKTGLPVHTGFNHTFNSMLPQIRSFLAENKITGRVHCIGHSLGGAVASLAADWIAKNTRLPTKLYTFGAPRVGTEWFASATSNTLGHNNIYRVYHETDPVTMVALYPFMHAPYRQAGYYIHSTEPLYPGAAHKMEKYNVNVREKSWKQLAATPIQPYDIESAVEAWSKSKSPVNTSSASFWRWVNAAFIYVFKKLAMHTLVSLQSPLIGLFTLADKIAYILIKGIDLADNVSIWVERLMRKLMSALGMKAAKSKKELTRDLIRQVLIRVTRKANNDARSALRNL